MKKNSIGIVGMILGIVGLVTSCVGAGGLFGLVGVILSIVGLTRKDSKKGSAIAGLITGGLSLVAGIIAAVIIILSLTGVLSLGGIMAPQLVKYNQASAVSADSQLCDSIRTAMLTAVMDPEVVMSDDYYDKEIYNRLRTPNEEFRLDSLGSGYADSKWGKAVNDMLGIDVFQDAKTFRKNFKSSPAKDEGVVYIKVDSSGNSFTVYVNDSVYSR